MATELFHAALLIQDDVMDNSNLRRGGMSMHKSLEGLGNRFDFRESQKIGESLALCAADVLIFLAYKLLDDLKLVDLFSRELHKTSFGQMLDVIGSAQEGTLTKDAILNIYKFKTARYTFTLPFMAACICAGQNPKQFEELGEDLGLIFNLKDDYLDFSDVSGKVKGLDFKENKQTMYRLLLSQKINIPETFEEYKQALEDQEIFSQVDSVILEYHMKILTTISNLNIPDDKKSELGQLATNLLKRVN